VPALSGNLHFCVPIVSSEKLSRQREMICLRSGSMLSVLVPPALYGMR